MCHSISRVIQDPVKANANLDTDNDDTLPYRSETVHPVPVLPTPVLPPEVPPVPVLPPQVLPVSVLPTPVLPPQILPVPVLSSPVISTSAIPMPVLPPYTSVHGRKATAPRQKNLRVEISLENFNFGSEENSNCGSTETDTTSDYEPFYPPPQYENREVKVYATLKKP